MTDKEAANQLVDYCYKYDFITFLKLPLWDIFRRKRLKRIIENIKKGYATSIAIQKAIKP